MNVYSVFDKKVSAFGPPFIARTDGEATRIVHSMLQDATSMFFRYAEDYVLHVIGVFDDQTGNLASAPGPAKPIAEVSALLPPPAPAPSGPS